MYCKYNMVGLSGALVNVAVFNALIFGVFFNKNYLLAYLVAFIVAVSNNFYWNYKWTFKEHKSHGSVRLKYIKFFLVGVTGLLISSGILFVLVDCLLLNKRMANILAIVAVSTFNFVANYLLTFAVHKKRQ